MPYQTKHRESRFCGIEQGASKNDPSANLAAFRRQASYGILGSSVKSWKLACIHSQSSRRIEIEMSKTNRTRRPDHSGYDW